MTASKAHKRVGGGRDRTFMDSVWANSHLSETQARGTSYTLSCPRGSISTFSPSNSHWTIAGHKPAGGWTHKLTKCVWFIITCKEKWSAEQIFSQIKKKKKKSTQIEEWAIITQLALQREDFVLMDDKRGRNHSQGCTGLVQVMGLGCHPHTHV